MTILEELIKYSNEVINGKIIACKKNIKACKRFLKDIERSKTDTFDYYWDEHEAQKIVQWFRYLKHTKGVLAGEPIELLTVQRFEICNIYAWKRKDNQYRRFKKAYIQKARKNAKSQEEAGMGLYELSARGESAAEIYCGATKKDQAKIVWKEADLMMTKPLRKRIEVKKSITEIIHKKSNSVMKVLSKDDGKKADGFNPQMAIIDEYHAHTTSEIYDVMVSGMGARREPLIVIITTAGDDFENKPCYAEYRYCSNLLNGIEENDEYFVFICELDKDDDIKDERNWIKANPILATYQEGINYLKGELKTALSDSTKMRTFLTKNMNIWVKEKDLSFIDNIEDWHSCRKDIKLEDFKGCECVIGVDLSSTRDLTSFSIEFPKIVDNKPKYAIFSHSYIPYKTLQYHVNNDKAPFDIWEIKHYLTATRTNEGLTNDHTFMINDIEEIVKKYDLKVTAIAYDDHQAGIFVSEMERRGYMCIKITQSARNLNDATVHFRDQVLIHNIEHDGNELLTWSAANAELIENSFKEVKIDKKSQNKRIDPIAATINAHKIAMIKDDKPDITALTEDYFKMMGWN